MTSREFGVKLTVKSSNLVLVHLVLGPTQFRVFNGDGLLEDCDLALEHPWPRRALAFALTSSCFGFDVVG